MYVVRVQHGSILQDTILKWYHTVLQLLSYVHSTRAGYNITVVPYGNATVLLSHLHYTRAILQYTILRWCHTVVLLVSYVHCTRAILQYTILQWYRTVLLLLSYVHCTGKVAKSENPALIETTLMWYCYVLKRKYYAI
jgi:hypothetical protein